MKKFKNQKIGYKIGLLFILIPLVGVINIVGINLILKNTGYSGSSLGIQSFLITLLIGSIALLFAGLYFSRTFLSRPINSIETGTSLLKTGSLDLNIIPTANDEIGLAITNLNAHTKNLQKAVTFAEKIGQGELSADFSPVSDNDKLGYALLDMRKKLQEVNEEDKKRNWATEGVARFSEILRNEQGDTKQLGQKIIGELVKYMKANQGALYIVNNEEEHNEYLELIALYAWDREKFNEGKIEKGVGLAGQAWMEKEITYLTEVPENYVKITSGLGKANPRSIIMVPLLLNEEVYGLIEMASFKKMEPHERQFMEKIAESIASTVAAAKVNEKTNYLLAKARQQAEELQSQEEEMRQNMEEMQATQEEMDRQRAEKEKKEEEMEKMIARMKANEEDMYQAEQKNRQVIKDFLAMKKECKAKDERIQELEELIKNKNVKV